MRRSKLESCEDILGALIRTPLTIDSIAYEINMDCFILKQHLTFLIKHSLVEERTVNEKGLYAITDKGINVLRALNFPKYLKKVSNTIRIVSEASQILPEFLGQNRAKDDKK